MKLFKSVCAGVLASLACSSVYAAGAIRATFTTVAGYTKQSAEIVAVNSKYGFTGLYGGMGLLLNGYSPVSIAGGVGLGIVETKSTIATVDVRLLNVPVEGSLGFALNGPRASLYVLGDVAYGVKTIEHDYSSSNASDAQQLKSWSYGPKLVGLLNLGATLRFGAEAKYLFTKTDTGFGPIYAPPTTINSKDLSLGAVIGWSL